MELSFDRVRNRHCVSILAAALIFVAIYPSPAIAAEAKKTETFAEKEIPFSDDAPKDATLFEFRNTLLKAVEARDLKALLGVLDPAILSSYDGQEGIDAFKAKWKLNEKPEVSPVWQELREALRLGGKLNKDGKQSYFIAPYVFYALPDEYDETEYGIIVGEGVNVRAKPDAASESVGKVGRIIVRLYAEEKPPVAKIGDETFPWRKVGLPNGATGYVWGKYVRSPIDYRAGFSNETGQWRMTYFLAGD